MDLGAAGHGDLDGMDAETASCTGHHERLAGLEAADVSQRMEGHPQGTGVETGRSQGQRQEEA